MLTQGNCGVGRRCCLAWLGLGLAALEAGPGRCGGPGTPAAGARRLVVAGRTG